MYFDSLVKGSVSGGAVVNCNLNGCKSRTVTEPAGETLDLSEAKRLRGCLMRPPGGSPLSAKPTSPAERGREKSL